MKHDISEELLSYFDGVYVADNDDLMDILVKIVDKTGKKFVCLIDEWDAFCREGMEKAVDEYVELLRRLFKGIDPNILLARNNGCFGNEALV